MVRLTPIWGGGGGATEGEDGSAGIGGANQQEQLAKAVAAAGEIASKKDCATFLNGIFAYATDHYQGNYGSDYASVASIVSLAQSAQYHISTPGDTTLTPGGVNVADKLAVPTTPGSSYTGAFVERGQNVVYVGQGAFLGNLGVIALHEALHISFYNPTTEKFVGFGLSDVELATSVGAYKQGMTNEEASRAFSTAMGKKCH
jgi:hypothetical protein